MLFPSPGSVLSTLHGQGHVVASGVRFLMGPSQRESHRLWSGRSLQRDVADTQRLQPRQWSCKDASSLENASYLIEKVYAITWKGKGKRRETEEDRQMFSHSISTEHDLSDERFQFLAAFLQGHWCFIHGWCELTLTGLWYTLTGTAPPLLQTEHLWSLTTPSYLIAHLTVIHLYTGQCLSLDFVVHSAILHLEMNLNCLSPIFNSQLLIKLDLEQRFHMHCIIIQAMMH